jgi:hypothetical protein
MAVVATSRFARRLTNLFGDAFSITRIMPSTTEMKRHNVAGVSYTTAAGWVSLHACYADGGGLTVTHVEWILIAGFSVIALFLYVIAIALGNVAGALRARDSHCSKCCPKDNADAYRMD